MSEATGEVGLSLLDLPPTLRQRRRASWTIVALAILYGISTPFANVPLPQLNGALEITLTLILIANLVSAALLFVQCSITRSTALLVLADGYLFSSLLMIPYLLTFPGVFAPGPILGAGIQGSPFLYNLWHFVFIAMVIGYALLRGAKLSSARFSIGWSVIIVVSVIFAIAWAISAHGYDLPHFLLEDGRLTPVGRYAPGIDLVIGVAALSILWWRGRSVLDQWLLVVIFAVVLELSLVTFFVVNRNSLGVNYIRLYLAVASTAVLIVLLAENARLYALLAAANLSLQRERDNKLMNIEAITAAIAHEVNQPLATIVANGSAALRFLESASPDLGEIRTVLNDMISDGYRTSEVFDNIRALFRKDDAGRQSLDVNDIILRVLKSLREELRNRGVEARVELASTLPLIAGHRGQLQEVIYNLIGNALDAMDTTTNRGRLLLVTTETRGSDAVVVSVQDSGPGIDPKHLESIFTAFITTKPQGIGLGLAICRMIIERHGGRLTVSSDGKNGALFQCVLPIRSAMAGAVREGQAITS